MSSLVFVALLGVTVASPAPVGTSSPSVGCSDACYSGIATYNNNNNPYSGNGICYQWLSSYPPAHTTVTYTGTEYLATVSPTTFATRVESVWTMASDATPAPNAYTTSAASATAISTQAKRGIERRQTTASPAVSSSIAGLPLPNSNIASSCSNDPNAFASACSCIGNVAQTSPAYTTTTMQSTTTHETITRECTSTASAPACVASASYGLARNTMNFGDGGSGGAPMTTFSNSTTAAECCNACFTSEQNCRFFTYTPPAGEDDMADGGFCALNLQGGTCPFEYVMPSDRPYNYNYVTEGMYADDGGNGALYGFGPCAQEVPYFYGYQNGRAGVGTCTAQTAITTVSAN